MKLYHAFRSVHPSRPQRSGVVTESEQSALLIPFRYAHHASFSGYERIAEYMQSNWLSPSLFTHVLGESILRPLAMLSKRRHGGCLYQRHDWVRGLAAALEVMKGNDKLVHLLYGEKSLDNSARVMRRFGAKVIATMHHPIEHHPKICGDLRWVDSLDGVICLTPESKHYWASRVGVDRVHLVPHGIDTVHYSPLERNRHLVQGSGEPVEVFFAGSHERNFDELERVANLVIAEGLPVRFNLVGRRSSLRALGERAPETVRVYSDISDSAYVDLIRASDVTYVPLKCGTACNTVLESLACGVPVISTQGTVDFYLSGGGGSLISPGDHDAALGAILSYRGRRSSRSDAGKRAREVAETFAWPVVAAQTQAVYEKVRGQ